MSPLICFLSQIMRIHIIVAANFGVIVSALTVEAKHNNFKLCHFTPSNIKNLLGPTVSTNPKDAYYRLAFQDFSFDKCLCEEHEKRVVLNSVFTHLGSCPTFLECQSFDEWKLKFRLLKINRFFSKLNSQVDVLKLYFLPIGPFPDFIHHYISPCGKTFFQLLCDYLKLFFTGCKVEILPEVAIETFNCKRRSHSLTKKDQYLVLDFFPQLRSTLPNDGSCIVALSWSDLYPSEQLNFLLGQGSYEHFSCISSFGRFDPTTVLGFQGKTDGILPENLKDITCVNSKLLYKLIKILSHEVCHVFGLHHCAMFSCLMNASKSTQEAMEQPMVLCPLCMKKLDYVLSNYAKNKGRFQIRTHLAALLHFFRVVFCEDSFDEADEDDGVIKQRIADTMAWMENVLNLLSSSS